MAFSKQEAHIHIHTVIKMAAGVDGITTALTIFTILTRLLASPTESVNTNFEFKIVDLGLYATRSFQIYLHREILIDLLHPRVDIKPTRHKYYQNKHITNVNYPTTICIRLLLLSGDVSLNPGPVQFPCGTCEKVSEETNGQSSAMIATCGFI